ncbi:hypothetical protein [Natrarchaeobaculum aegyptiacum]|uniref:DUF8009 domain-containing protein n=1 Tax=Natrarchaeobaculum aegyptiacum TaxID=745377 RepID=A0A2Z2HWZ3_9EURY|nr:hypothetical protein [Natrarchaeobaculum aegyptiacum]ARS91899.1 hypothetical protein B1756_16480 [Natrarchaeobaculum aegyptiacum]
MSPADESGPGSKDPTVIRSLAVSSEDAVDAFLYGRENPGESVLRVTPPFHGRMRARLHVYHVDDAPLTGAIHLEPSTVLESAVVEGYPSLETALEGVDGGERADPGEVQPAASADAVRERHAAAVEQWRERALSALVDSVTLETPAGPHQVDVKPLG